MYKPKKTAPKAVSSTASAAGTLEDPMKLRLNRDELMMKLRQERQAKLDARLAKVRAQKLEKANMFEPSIKPSRPLHEKSKCTLPVVRQTLTSKKRMESFELLNDDEMKKLQVSLKKKPMQSSLSTGALPKVKLVEPSKTTSVLNRECLKPLIDNNHELLQKVPPKYYKSKENKNPANRIGGVDKKEKLPTKAIGNLKPSTVTSLANTPTRIPRLTPKWQPKLKSTVMDPSVQGIADQLKDAPTTSSTQNQTKINTLINVQNEIKIVNKRKSWVLPQPASKFQFVLPKLTESLINQDQTKQPALRRSLTTIHRKRLNKDEIKKCIRKRSISLREGNIDDMDTITEVVFKTPVKSAKGACITASSAKRSTPGRQMLQERLIKWLKTHGKLKGYLNLQNFSVSMPSCDNVQYTVPKATENRSNPESNQAYHHGENTAAETVRLTPEASCSVNEDMIHSTPITKITESNVQVAETILNDIYNLILEGYPVDQCEHWFKLVKQQYSMLKALPIYWECKAALQDNNGEFYSAVDSYQRAVTRGAEPNRVKAQLDSLVEKFKDLKIDTTKFSLSKTIVQDADSSNIDKCNTFTSRLIKFAIQQKTHVNMSSDLQYIITPVRRSSRLFKPITPSLNGSILKAASTPTCYYSTSEASTIMQKSLVFKPNMALDSPE